MHPKWGRSPSLAFNFEIYSKKRKRNYCNLTVHVIYTKLIESLHNILFLKRVADLRYGEEDSNCPSTLVFATRKG